MLIEKYGKDINNNLKILIISQYYWPENFRINELTEELTKFGHKITVLTGYPNYPNGVIYKEFRKNKSKFRKYKGAEVVRVPILPRKNNKFNLLINYISFLFSSIIFGYFKLRAKNFDIVFTFQLSPVTIGITSAFFSKIKNCPQVFWVLDLWPDTLLALDIIKARWQLNLLKILVNWIYSQCDSVLVQSKNFLNEINTYPSIRNNTYYFPSWGDSDLFKKDSKPANEIKDKKIFTVLFAGNIGKAQDFPNLIKAVKILSLRKIENFRILLIGDGSEKESLKKEIKRLKLQRYFELYKNYPIKRMGSFFKYADVLLVNLLNKKVFNMTIPGKIQFYLSSGIPIIGMIGGEGADIIKESKAGLVCKPGDYRKLAEIIFKLINLDKKYLRIMGENGKKYSNKEFSKTKLIKRLNNLLIKVSKKK